MRDERAEITIDDLWFAILDDELANGNEQLNDDWRLRKASTQTFTMDDA